MLDSFKSNFEQRKFWSGEFGEQYIKRNDSDEKINNNYKKLTGLNRDDIFIEFFNDLDKNIEILELGCNIGKNFSILKKMGFTRLSGVEINSKAIDIAKIKYPDINFYYSSIEELKLPEKSFDLVFTSGVLIHINPDAVKAIIEKMLTLSKKYIFGFESYSEVLTSVLYRGNNNKYWKQNFPKLFKKINPKLNLLKEKKIKYLDQELYDIFYLFEM